MSLIFGRNATKNLGDFHYRKTEVPPQKTEQKEGK